MSKLKSKSEIIKNRSCGLKYLDEVVKFYGDMKSIIDKGIDLSLQNPGVWGPTNSWIQFDWAFGNAMRVNYKKDIATYFNLDEALTDDELKYVANRLNITEPYVPPNKRKL